MSKNITQHGNSDGSVRLTNVVERQNTGQIKARRTLRACDFCSGRAKRCRPSHGDPARCQNCVDHGEACTSNRPLKRRGAKPANSRTEPKPPITWTAVPIAPHNMVVSLVEIYFKVVYPIFPFFHEPTLLRDLTERLYLHKRSLFASVMAVCALASARARDGAVFSSKWDLETLKEPQSEVFFSASESAIPLGPMAMSDFDYMRACALLSITAIQYGQSRAMLYYLGLYHTMVETDGLHDESNWPTELDLVEKEERRRLFWSIYTLDVYASIVWGRTVRSREAQSNVLYPSAIDEDINCSLSSDSHPSAISNTEHSYSQNWLYGWNFTTDLYRILEHVLDHFRQTRSENRLSTPIDALFGGSTVSNATVLDVILNMYKSLSRRFKETPAATQVSEHRLNFQTANIAATIQLVRIMLFASEDATVEQRCTVANELLSAFADIPSIYLRAISSPLLHHLAGIGQILGSVFEKGLPESAYQRIRSVLLAMVDLLADLEVGLYWTANASSRIQELVLRIDDYISKERQQMYLSDARSDAVARSNQRDSAVDAATEQEAASPLFQFPSELLDDWSWAFDFNQNLL
ncbi:hypothetical protein NA57DRAFT_69364 [Rhizodiscina lignyota]|uniref:Xylanolytic transcriptional activator regulatory domain-containing protein n=1 Tax=Rhizodiscina lignyota TaxID=1504668 RepID=A0A9P4I3T5_9PEZI|nr:hypothetical protein NA57DRAFT_69364 [Rhizodiscina lignyota]